MSLSPDLEKLMRQLEEKWHSLTPKQQAQYLRKKAKRLAEEIEELDRPAQ